MLIDLSTLAVDSSASYLPVHYRSFAITVRLQETDGVVATQKWDAGEIKVQPKRVTSYQVSSRSASVLAADGIVAGRAYPR